MSSEVAYFAQQDKKGTWFIAIGTPEGWTFVNEDTDLGGPCKDEHQARAIAARANKAYARITPKEASMRLLQWSSRRISDKGES